MKNVLLFLIKSRSVNDDLARREYILNVFLLGTFLLCLVATLSAQILLIYTLRRGETDLGASVSILWAVSFVFLALYFFSRAGKSKLVAYIFVGLYFLLAVYTSFSWGVDVPQSLLAYALVIVIAGVLISTKFAIIATIFISITLFSLASLQINKIVLVNSLWRNRNVNLGDVVVYIITLAVISTASWLSNREIEKALEWARSSEKALQKERNSLEIKVEKRTRELQKIELEKIMQIYRFADFGKLAAGLFHDLVSPLNVVSLNLENLKEETIHDRSKNIKEIRKVLGRAIYSTKGIEKFVKNIRAQLQGQQTKSNFSLTQETCRALKELTNKASKARVKLNFNDRISIHTFGNQLRFHQMVINLVLNAIDSYNNIKRKSNRIIYIRLYKQNKLIILEVEDFGVGVTRHVLHHIFDPFYTTKPIGEGIGIGLTICKDIVEKDFGGRITVKSQLRKGTTFTIKFPIIGRKSLK